MNLTKEIYSTLCKQGKTKLVESFSTNMIIQKYKSENHIDVSRFFQGSDELKLLECLDTGYRFYYPKNVIGDALFYKELATHRENYYSRRWEHKKALKSINRADKVLEIGSGFGSFLELLIENDCKDVRGIELSELAVQRCKEKGLNVDSKLIEDFDESTKFDVICSFQVLEHVYDVNSFLNSAIRLLKSGGKLIIGVPNNNPYLHIIDKYHTLNLPPHHAGLWSKKSLKSLPNIFPLKLSSINCEPLENSYSYFLNFYFENSNNKFLKNILKILNRINKKMVKYLITAFVSGRNILVVYKKN